MKRKYNRAILSAVIAAMTVSTLAPAAYAGELEGDSAVAGMAVSLNNYYAGSETPDEAILDYLVPLVQSTLEDTEAAEPQEVRTVMEATVSDEELGLANLGVVSAPAYLNVRETPSTSAKTVGKLYSNCQVAIKNSLSNSEGDWYAITCGEVEGYVSAAYILTGDAAAAAESNIKNRYAVVTVDSLDVVDSASDQANVISTVYLNEEYPIQEDHGDYVKVYLGERGVGYVAKSGIKIKTQFAEALKIDDEYITQELESYIGEISYSRNVYEERMSAGNYYEAYSAISYAAELLGYYIVTAENYGLTDLAAAAKTEQADAQAKADAAYALAKDSGYFEQAAAAVASSNAAETAAAETVPAAAEGQPAEQPQESSAADSGEIIPIEIPTAAYVTGIEACYQGGHKYVGDVIYSAELFVRVTYSDGTVKDVYDGWYSPEVGMMLRNEGYNVVTMYYDNYSSALEVWADPVPTQPQPTEPPTQPAEQPVQPSEAPAPTPTEATPAPTEPTPAPTEPTQAPTQPSVTGDASRNQVVSTALSWVGRCNYVYGGTNLVDGGGVDCSGFTMNIYSTVGISLPHYSGSQASCGYAVSDPVPGDLVCFSGHVGIYIGDGMMVHAASEDTGIITSPVSSCSKPFIGYRRLIG